MGQSFGGRVGLRGSAATARLETTVALYGVENMGVAPLSLKPYN